MTYDVIAVLRGTPETPAILAAILDAGDDLQFALTEDAPIIAVYDVAGQPLAAIEPPTLLQVAGEAVRLLGPIAADLAPPVWWLEIHALEHAAAIAQVIGTSVAARLNGIVWHPEVAG